jgi:soluble lytic murein transglycosylase-like protein
MPRFQNMRKILQFGALVAAGSGMLAAQWLNMPVERAQFRAEPLTVAKLESIKNAEAEIRRHQSDERAARQVLIPYGTRCEALSSLAAMSARRHNLQPRIVAATIVAESTCRDAIVSKAGAVGLMQIECQHTWRQYSRQELMNPERNADVGADILARYVREGGSTREGLKRYFGVTRGSDQADIYADRVLSIAGRIN